MDLRELLILANRYKHQVAVLCLSAMITATVMTYVLSEKYRSVAMVLVRPQKSPAVAPYKEEMLDFPVSYFTPVAETTRTYTEMLKSKVIAERIVAELSGNLLAPAPAIKGWRGLLASCKNGAKKFISKTWTLLMYGRIEKEDPRSGAIKEVQKALTVKPTKETFLFEIQSEAKSGEMAAKIANTAARIFAEYLRERARNHTESGRASREETRNRARREFEQRQQAVVEYKQRFGTLSPKKEADLALEALAGLDQMRTELDKRIEGSKARLAELENQLARSPKFTRSQSKEADNPLFMSLSLELEKKEVALVGLLKKFTPEHRDVKVLQSEIDELKARMGSQKPVRQSEETLAVDRVYEALSVERARCVAELEALKAEQDRIVAEQQDRRKRLTALPEKEAELAALDTMAELSQEKYRIISKHLDEMELATAMDFPAIEVVQDAYIPLYPSRPIKIYHAVLAGILALLAGIGLALASENLRQGARRAEPTGTGSPRASLRETSPASSIPPGQRGTAAVVSSGNNSGEDYPGI